MKTDGQTLFIHVPEYYNWRLELTEQNKKIPKYYRDSSTLNGEVMTNLPKDTIVGMRLNVFGETSEEETTHALGLILVGDGSVSVPSLDGLITIEGATTIIGHHALIRKGVHPIASTITADEQVQFVNGQLHVINSIISDARGIHHNCLYSDSLSELLEPHYPEGEFSIRAGDSIRVRPLGLVEQSPFYLYEKGESPFKHFGKLAKLGELLHVPTPFAM